MMLNMLFVLDPVEKILPHMDTSLRIIEEALHSGHQVFFLDIRNELLRGANSIEALMIQEIKSCQHQQKEFFDLGPQIPLKLNEIQIVFHRLDPPVDDLYKKYCAWFEGQNHLLQINDPWQITHVSEHILPTEFPDYSIPTTVCRSLDELVSYVQKNQGESVVKPENECSGIGIEFFNHTTSVETLRGYWNRFSPEVIAQPYREIITTSGDLRVLVYNEVILGGVLRKAKSGSRLSNIHQGGSAHPFEVTPKQKEISREVCRELKKRGLYFVGLDFIGEELSEINITSPTTLTYINDFYGIKGEKIILDETLKLWEQKK